MMFARKAHIQLFSKYLVCIMLLSSLFLLSSCSGEDAQLKKTKEFVADVKKIPGPPVEPLPEVATPQLPETNQLNTRNPFAPKAAAPSSTKPDMNHPKGPLEMIPLNQLTFVGILSSSNQQWALISTPNGTIYNISVGQYIGQNYGKVTQITDQKVIVDETVSTGLGDWATQIKELPLTPASQKTTP